MYLFSRFHDLKKIFYLIFLFSDALTLTYIFRAIYIPICKTVYVCDISSVVKGNLSN